MKQWIFIALALTIATTPAISGGDSSAQRWQRMVEEDEPNDIVNQWANLTPQQLRNFIAAGVNINAKNSDGQTPLHFVSTSNGDIRIIRELLKAGANIHAKDKNGGTPLHRAVNFNESIEVIEELTKAGADIHAEDDKGRTPCDMLKNNDETKNNSEAKNLLCR